MVEVERRCQSSYKISTDQLLLYFKTNKLPIQYPFITSIPTSHLMMLVMSVTCNSFAMLVKVWHVIFSFLLFQQLQLLVLTEVTVAAAVICHSETRGMPLSHLDRQGEPGAFNRARRHQAYRQFVLWRYVDSVCGRPKSRNHQSSSSSLIYRVHFTSFVSDWDPARRPYERAPVCLFHFREKYKYERALSPLWMLTSQEP